MRRTDAAGTTPRGPTFPFPQPGWRGTAEGECTWVSPAWTMLTGQTGLHAMRWGWLSHVHDDDRLRLARMWRRAAIAGHGRTDVRLIAANGVARWFRIETVRDPAQTGWSAVGMDVDDLHQQLADKRAQRAALQHRVRNTLAVIRSIARRTAENSETVEDYRVHFDGRLAAFARTQSHVLRASERGVDLEALLADEFLANRAGDDVTIAGPEVRLAPRLADLLGLAFHELVANAVQFGALSGDGGRLDIAWHLAGDRANRWLHFAWRETLPASAPSLAAPDHEGFGLELLTRSLPYEVDARVEVMFQVSGLRVELHVPIDGGRLARPRS